LPPFVNGDLSAQVTTTSFGDFSRIAERPDDGTGLGLGSEAKCEETWERRSWALFGAFTCQHLKLVLEMEEGIYPVPWWVVVVIAGFKVNWC